MNNEGWMKLHRKLKNSSFYRRSTVVHLFIHLLLSANHTAKKFYWNGKEIELEEGQLITGLHKLSQDTGISPQSIRTAMMVLKSTSTITSKSTNKFSLITIANWQDYQGGVTSKLTSKLTNDQQTTNKQLTTNKNDKKEKNEKKRDTYAYLLNIPLEDKRYFIEKFNINTNMLNSKVEDLYNYCLSKGITYKNYKAFVTNALKKDFGERKVKVKEVIKEYGQME